MTDSYSTDEAHWSGTFQRLRAETVVMAIVLLAATQLELNLSKLPILGIEFTKSIPKGPVVIFLYVFFLYFVSAWIVRYRREKSILEADRRNIDSLRDRMLDVITETKGTTLAFAGDVLASARVLEENIATLGRKHTDFLPEVSQATKAYEDAVQRLRKVASDGISTSQIERTDALIKDAYHPIAIETKLEEIYGAFNHYQAIVETAEHRVSAAINEAKTEMDARGPALERAIAGIRSLVDGYVLRLRNLRSSLFYDLEFLGFFIPLAFSIVLAGYSLPQGLLDAMPTLHKIGECIQNPSQGKCWLRSTGGRVDIDLGQTPPEFLRAER